ncbi:MAG: mechanosensitive ion channel [Planctomycetota bacterium]|nr:mechanosensitive ion channel [Planctomycetota bacterium]
MFASLWETLGALLPKLAMAVGLLLVFYVAGLILRAIVRKALGLLKLDSRVANGTGKTIGLQSIFASVVFYVVLLLGVVAALNVLELQLVSAPLQSMLDKTMAFLPNLVAGAVLILVAWLVATFLRNGAKKALAQTSLDEKLSEGAGVKPISDSLAQVLYGLTLLFFLPAILGAFQLYGLLEPVQGMMDKFLSMLPNIFAAAAIGFAGWFVANLVKNLVVNLLHATGAEKALAKLNLPTNVSLGKIVGILIYVAILVPAIVAALDALKIESISRPATDMLSMLMTAIPNILAAGIILTVAWFVAKFVSTILVNLLQAIGFDNLPGKMGVAAIVPDGTAPSAFVGRVATFFLMLFASVEAANRLQFTQFADVVETFIRFGGQVLLGVTIILIGFWISNLAHGAIRRIGGNNAALLANVARFAIVGIVLAMGLNAMEIADQVVNLAFGLTLGAVAVAFALMFGLGGREPAGRQLEHWFRKWRGEG